MSDFPLSTELQHLSNMIAKAKSDVSVRLLRDELRTFAADACDADIIKIAQVILQCGIAQERTTWSNRN